jgi:hypothetical protein
MSETDLGKLILGLASWTAVAVFAVIIEASVDNKLWGFFPVLAAVIAAWAIGEWIVHPEERQGGAR